ncbi:MAG: hypothetical protein Kow00121_32590 [Elainellaceae cyanobacterium]
MLEVICQFGGSQIMIKRIAMKLVAIPAVLFSLGTFTPFAFANPSIASGEKPLETDLQGCLVRADLLLKQLDLTSLGEGSFYRSGSYDEGAFRILCYDVGNGNSLAILFVAHETSQEMANDVLDRLLNEF